MGLSNTAPPSSTTKESTQPRSRVAAFPPPDRACHTRPRSALVVSHHLDGFLLLDRLGMLHPMPTLGFVAFPPAANRLPRGAFPPFRALLPDGSGDPPHRSVSNRGRSSPGPRRCRRLPVHRSPCPLVVVSSSRLRVVPVATAGPCSTTGAVANRHVAAPTHPLLSWACPSPMPTCAAPDVATGRAPVARSSS